MKKSPTRLVLLIVTESSNLIYYRLAFTLILLLFTYSVVGQSIQSPSADMLQIRQASQFNKTDAVSKHQNNQALRQAVTAFSVQQADAITNPLLQIIQSLVGPGITVSNIQTTLPQTSNIYGSFTGGLTIVGMDRGLLMTSGSVINALGPNISPSTSQINGLPGYYPIDPDGFDAAVISFDVESNTPFMSFKYVFASEEYNEYVGSPFNDDFAFLISGPGIPAGTNIATIPGTSTYVAINNVNLGLNPQFYINNDSIQNANPVRFQDLEYDGLTTVLTTSPITVVPGATYTITLIVQDVSDEVYDSGVFIEGGSITSDSCLIGLFSEIVDDTCGSIRHKGSVELTVNGIFGTAQYLWSNGETTREIEHLSPGTYSVIVTDSKGCTATLTSQVGLWCENTVTLNLKVFIEGFYIGNGTMMAVAEPINDPMLCDTITIELHDAVFPYDLAYIIKGTIDIYGDGTFIFPGSVQGNSYYLAVHHRNSIETWSKTPVLFDTPIISFDLTSP